MTSDALHPAMPLGGPAEYDGATWIGAIDDDDPRLVQAQLPLVAGEGFASSRLLVRSGGQTRGFITAPITDSSLSCAQLREQIAALPERGGTVEASRLAITVTVSTRNRPDHLRGVLDSLLALDYDNLRFLIVDNASDDEQVAEIVAGLGDDRFRSVVEPRPGLSCGRNRALVEADTPIIAFTDDDVVVDRAWITHIAAAFESADDIALVTGMVPTGELRTPSQAYFERQTHWQQICTPTTFRLSQPPADILGFPLNVGRYGTGANFAMRRDIGIRLGGFNEALGIGSPTHGGEDLDMFLRVLYAGFALSYAPDAIVWHRHRADTADLEKAVRGYGVSWGAWLFSLLENPTVRRDALRIGAQHSARRLRSLASRSSRAPLEADLDRDDFDLTLHGFEGLPRMGTLSVAEGPKAYVQSRRQGRRIRPLLGHRIGGADREQAP